MLLGFDQRILGVEISSFALDSLTLHLVELGFKHGHHFEELGQLLVHFVTLVGLKPRGEAPLHFGQGFLLLAGFLGLAQQQLSLGAIDFAFQRLAFGSFAHAVCLFDGLLHMRQRGSPRSRGSQGGGGTGRG